jgi:methylated-DNA-[protein]-cysteine S-methyltransferase
MPQRTIETPVGPVRIACEGDYIATIRIDAVAEPDIGGNDRLLDQAAAQLAAYFAGTAEHFDLPLVPALTSRGAALRAAICGVPSGATITYGTLALASGSSARAIGQACARNPLPIVVPCHRIVASGGLGAYSAGGGIATKDWLLRHESKERMLWEI